MKKLLLALSLALFLAVPAFADAFQEGNAKYQAGDFKAAADKYLSAVKTGNATVDVYYNLGNASFKMGKKGQAMLAYRRALKAAPRDGDIRWNVQVLKTSLPDRLDPAPSFSVLIDDTLELVSDGEAAAALLVILTALFAVSLAVYFRPSAALKGLRTFFLFLAVVAAAAAYFKWVQVRDPHFVVLDKEVRARYGPTEQETQAFVLHEGAVARVLDESGSWLYLQLPTGGMGWVPKKAGEIV